MSPLPSPDAGDGAPRPWPTVHPVRRLGPILVVLAALIGAGVTATVHEHSASPGNGVGPASTRGLNALGLTAAEQAQLPVTYAAAQAKGTQNRYDWGPHCDRATGRLKIPVVYGPECVPVFKGSNGGATTPGVSATTITVAYYQAPADDLAAALEGESEPPALTLATARGYVKLLNTVMPLYGRHVKLVLYQGTGISTDSVAATADAINVAQELHAFASIGGPDQTPAYQDELAREHVLCLGCGLSVAYSDFSQDAPYLWGSLPTPDSELTESFDLVLHDLVGKKAVYAGQASLRRHTRVLALVHYDQDPPVYSSITNLLTKEFTGTKFKLALQQSYLLDLSQLPDEAATIAAHLKHAGITTVIFAGDPIMPIYLTKACAAIDYYPEWIVTGTVLTDTSALARLYNQKEWSHAFGISSLSAGVPLADGDAQRIYQWFYGTQPPADATASLIDAPLGLLYGGLELAGPDLNAYTFRAGLFASPPTGGGPATPEVAYGDQGAAPRPSYSTPADYSIIWYDASAKGDDEQGKDGTGLYRRIDGGQRFSQAHPPPANITFFQRAGSVTSFTKLPASDRPPHQPPWPGSPVTRR